MKHCNTPLLFIAFLLSACVQMAENSPETNSPGSVPESKGLSSNGLASISAPAEVISQQQIAISPPSVAAMWQFKIQQIAREGTLVEKGDVLVRFDGQKLKSDLLRRQSELDAAIKDKEKTLLKDEETLEQLLLDVAEAKKNVEVARLKSEITDHSQSKVDKQINHSEFEITSLMHVQAIQKLHQHRQAMTVNLEVENARVADALSHVEGIKQGLKRLTVTAPESGMVVLVPGRDNSKPAVGDSVWMGNTLMELPSLQQLAIKVEIDESHYAAINKGAAVKVVLDEHPERSFNGEVDKMGKSFRSKSFRDPQVVIDIWVKLTDEDNELMRPGMKASVEFI